LADAHGALTTRRPCWRSQRGAGRIPRVDFHYLWIRAKRFANGRQVFERRNWRLDYSLEPHFTQVGWFSVEHGYNILSSSRRTVGSLCDRWRWVERGSTAAHDGLRYNPNDVLMYRELAWFFQHKMGQNLDDANWYYKQQWAGKYAVFGANGTNFSELLQPHNTNAVWLREKYKLTRSSRKNERAIRSARLAAARSAPITGALWVWKRRRKILTR